MWHMYLKEPNIRIDHNGMTTNNGRGQHRFTFESESTPSLEEHARWQEMEMVIGVHSTDEKSHLEISFSANAHAPLKL
jgi:hypothetical protein